MPTVDLSVGHGVKPDGRYDPGATGGGTDEQRAGDILVTAVEQRLRDYPIDVTSVETYADDPNYVGSVRRINGAKPDLAVTFHHDWSGAPTGAFAHWYQNGTDGHRAADHIIRAVASAGFSIRTDWHRERPGLYFLSKTAVPAVLVEAGRIGQYTQAELKAFGKAAAEGIAGYFGIEPVRPHTRRYQMLVYAPGAPDAAIVDWAEAHVKPVPGVVTRNYDEAVAALERNEDVTCIGTHEPSGAHYVVGDNRQETAKKIIDLATAGWKG